MVDGNVTPEEEDRMGRTAILIALALALAVVCTIGVAGWSLWQLARRLLR